MLEKLLNQKINIPKALVDNNVNIILEDGSKVNLEDYIRQIVLKVLHEILGGNDGTD